MKQFLFIAALALTTSGSALAQQRTGGSTGGGSHLNHKLIEEYAISPQEISQKLPDFEKTDEYIETIKKLVPDFGAKIERAKYESVWYLVPEKISNLPVDKTGLHFSSNQPAYQIGQEIFVSDVDIGNKDVHPNTRARTYLHELFMMVHPTKDVSATRQLVVFFQQNNANPQSERFAQKIKTLGFGEYLSQMQIDSTEKFFKRTLENLIVELNKICISDEKDEHLKLRRMSDKISESALISAENSSNPKNQDAFINQGIAARNKLYENSQVQTLFAALIRDARLIEYRHGIRILSNFIYSLPPEIQKSIYARSSEYSSTNQTSYTELVRGACNAVSAINKERKFPVEKIGSSGEGK